MSKQYTLPEDEASKMAGEPAVAYAVKPSPVFTMYQMQILDSISHVHDEKEMGEISDLLSNYFAQKAIAEADSLWDKGEINDASVSGWKHEHMRTRIALA